jgi:hypothetical protein
MLIYDEGDIKAYISRQGNLIQNSEKEFKPSEDYVIEVRINSEYIGDDGIALISALKSFVQNIQMIMKI